MQQEQMQGVLLTIPAKVFPQKVIQAFLLLPHTPWWLLPSKLENIMGKRHGARPATATGQDRRSNDF